MKKIIVWNSADTMYFYLFIGVLHRFQHCTGLIRMGRFVGRGNQYTKLVEVLYCKLPTIVKELPTLPFKVRGLNKQSQSWEVSMLPLCHHGPSLQILVDI